MPGVIIGIVGLNLFALGLLYFYPAPGCGAHSLEADCNFPDYIDSVVLGSFRWSIRSSVVGAILPATTSVLFDVLAGKFLLVETRQRQRVLWFLGAGIALIAAGKLLSIWVPINKQLWTTSFAVFMAGLSAIGLAVSIWLIDDRPWQHWFRPLETLGLNAIAAYIISRIVEDVPRVHVMGRSFYADVLAPVFSPQNASFLFAFAVLIMVYAVVWFLDRWGLHLKL